MVLKFKDKGVLHIKSVVIKLPFVWVCCDAQGRFFLVNAAKIVKDEIIKDEENDSI